MSTEMSLSILVLWGTTGKKLTTLKLNAVLTGKIFTNEKPRANIHDLTEI